MRSIEKKFSSCNLVEQVCVLGSGLPQPIGIVVLSETAQGSPRASVKKEIGSLMGEVNQQIENFEKLKKIVIVEDEWSTDSGILTPTMKIKRNVVEKKYSPKFQHWFDSKPPVFFGTEV